MRVHDTVAPGWRKGEQATPFGGQILCSARGIAVTRAKRKRRWVKMRWLKWLQQLFRLQQCLEERLEVQQQLQAELLRMHPHQQLLAQQRQLEQQQEGLQQGLQPQGGLQQNLQVHTLAVEQHLQQQTQQLQQEQPVDDVSESLQLFPTLEYRRVLEQQLQQHQQQQLLLHEQQVQHEEALHEHPQQEHALQL